MDLRVSPDGQDPAVSRVKSAGLAASDLLEALAGREVPGSLDLLDRSDSQVV